MSLRVSYSGSTGYTGGSGGGLTMMTGSRGVTGGVFGSVAVGSSGCCANAIVGTSREAKISRVSMGIPRGKCCLLRVQTSCRSAFRGGLRPREAQRRARPLRIDPRATAVRFDLLANNRESDARRLEHVARLQRLEDLPD